MGRNREDKPKVERDPKKVFLLACEGRHTERKYFIGLKDELKNKNLLAFIDINIFEKSDSDLSNPKNILEEIIKKKEKDGFEEDEIYLIVDRDDKSFTEKQFNDVKSECFNNGYKLILSNPSFELWLLFHFIESFNEDDKNSIKSDKTFIENRLQQFLLDLKKSRAKKFNKKILFEHYKDEIDNAVKIAKENEHDLEKLKDIFGTNVFTLVEAMKEV